MFSEDYCTLMGDRNSVLLRRFMLSPSWAMVADIFVLYTLVLIRHIIIIHIILSLELLLWSQTLDAHRPAPWISAPEFTPSSVFPQGKIYFELILSHILCCFRVTHVIKKINSMNSAFLEEWVTVEHPGSAEDNICLHLCSLWGRQMTQSF